MWCLFAIVQTFRVQFPARCASRAQGHNNLLPLLLCLAQCDYMQRCKSSGLPQAAAAAANNAARALRERLAAAEAGGTDMVQRLQAVRRAAAQQLPLAAFPCRVPWMLRLYVLGPHAVQPLAY